MRLRELTFPIAVRKTTSLMGGRNAGLHKICGFDFNIAEYYKKGGYDDVTIYDSMGREFSVAAIEFRRPHWIHYLRSRAGNFFILPDRDKADMVTVDMQLQFVKQHTLNGFCTELRELALQNPKWWKRHSSQKEIESMFENCSTFAEAINDIGVLDAPGKEKLKGKSNKIVDLR